MGSGKTTIGKQLARKLAYTFVDSDSYIESKENKTIAQIFELHGEEHFRLLEKKYLHELCESDNCVISTGGGLPCFFDNMDFINNKGLSIYLQLPPAALVSRLSNSKKDRPLIKDKTDEEMLGFITEALNKREVFYNKAILNVSGLSLNVAELLELVEQNVIKYL